MPDLSNVQHDMNGFIGFGVERSVFRSSGSRLQSFRVPAYEVLNSGPFKIQIVVVSFQLSPVILLGNPVLFRAEVVRPLESPCRKHSDDVKHSGFSASWQHSKTPSYW